MTDDTPASQMPLAPICSPCAENDDRRCCGTGECWLCPLNKIEATSGVSFQQRVDPWLLTCFGEVIARDRQERNHRFLEEAIELAQACECTASEAHQLVDYVFGRPVGDPEQEVGGVAVTLAALCLARGIDMHAAGETELARVWTMVEKIRAKQAAKPKHSPLPEATARTCAVCGRPPHPNDDAECVPASAPISQRLEVALDALSRLRRVNREWHAQAVALGFDGVGSLLERRSEPANVAAAITKADAAFPDIWQNNPDRVAKAPDEWFRIGVEWALSGGPEFTSLPAGRQEGPTRG